MLKRKLTQLGQGMTEYIIIVALIAIAAIAVYGFFGDTIRGQMGIMTQELTGNKANAALRTSVGNANTKATNAGAARTLKNFEQ